MRAKNPEGRYFKGLGMAVNQMEQALVYKLFGHNTASCCLCSEGLIVGPDHPYRHICSFCLSGLQREAPPCFRCGIALPANEIGTVTRLLTCGDCLANQPIQYRSVCAFSYRFPLTELIAQMKFQNQFKYVPMLVELFSAYCKHAYRGDSMPEAIIAVPLHAKRAFKRGFNQAELMAYYIADELELNLLQSSVYKSKSTSSQMSLSIKERQKNLRGAFELSSTNQVKDFKHIALFDDVITTGATMHNLAKVIASTGVKRVDCWSIARTPKHFT